MPCKANQKFSLIFSLMRLDKDDTLVYNIIQVGVFLLIFLTEKYREIHYFVLNL